MLMRISVSNKLIPILTLQGSDKKMHREVRITALIELISLISEIRVMEHFHIDKSLMILSRGTACVLHFCCCSQTTFESSHLLLVMILPSHLSLLLLLLPSEVLQHLDRMFIIESRHRAGDSHTRVINCVAVRYKSEREYKILILRRGAINHNYLMSSPMVGVLSIPMQG